LFIPYTHLGDAESIAYPTVARKKDHMVQLDWPLLFNAGRLVDGSNVHCLAEMIFAYQQAVKLHNGHHPGHEKYQDESELKLRGYVIDQNTAALEHRIPSELRHANELIKKSAELHAKSNELEYPAGILKCPKCAASIPDKRVLRRCAEIANRALVKKMGPEHFREMQAKRKHRRGGRPPNKGKRTPK
jgi:hypothetical protein